MSNLLVPTTITLDGEQSQSTTTPPSPPIGSDVHSYVSLCIQHDRKSDNDDKYSPLDWWNLSHGFMEFLRATDCTSSRSTCPASKLRDLTEMKRYIFSFLKDPKYVRGVRFCTYRMCSGVSTSSKQPCRYSVCERHGWEDPSLYSESCRCADSNCIRVFCWEHNNNNSISNDYSNVFYCDACNNGIYAEISYGCYNCAPNPIFCSQHKPILCSRRIGSSSEEEGEEEEEEYDSDEEVNRYDDEDSSKEDEAEICGFYCCPKCIDNHICGDDPHLYL